MKVWFLISNQKHLKDHVFDTGFWFFPFFLFLFDAKQVITDPDLRERHLGDPQGLVFREAAKLSPEAYKAFLSHRTDQYIQ